MANGNLGACLIWTFLMMLGSGFSFAQETQPAQPAPPQYGWKNEIIGNLNLTQASFSNWEQGGENTLAWQVNLTTNFVLDQEKATAVRYAASTLLALGVYLGSISGHFSGVSGSHCADLLRT